MPIKSSMRPIARKRLEDLARSLLDASCLCAIATVGKGGRAHINTAYFAVSTRLDLVWLSDPSSRHSRNIQTRSTVAVAVYNSEQSWGAPDRGIQLFGVARETRGGDAPEAERIYLERFPSYDAAAFSGYRLYRFRPRRVKLFDEGTLGSATFATAAVHEGRLEWVRTEILRST
jgi:uncharacterized protein YhbP (UPF0306 family)